MFLYMNTKLNDSRREVNDFMTGRGRPAIYIILGLLGLYFIVSVVLGLF